MAFLTINEAAKLLKLHPATLRRHARRGKVPGLVKIGRTLRIDADKLRGAK